MYGTVLSEKQREEERKGTFVLCGFHHKLLMNGELL